MDEEKYKRLHYELWDWISEEPLRDKKHWPEWKCIYEELGHIENHCFACHYFGTCFECPLGYFTGRVPSQGGQIYNCPLFELWNYYRQVYMCIADFHKQRPSTIKKLYINELKRTVKQAALEIRDAWK